MLRRISIIDGIARTLGVSAVTGIVFVPPVGLLLVGHALLTGNVTAHHPFGPHVGAVILAELLALLALLASVGLSSWSDWLRARGDW